MKVAILALGSRGDVQPYVALGRGLTNAGHTVRLLSHGDFQALAQAQSLDFWPMRGSVQAIAESPEMQALLESGNFIAITARTSQAARQAALDWAEDGLAALTGMDLIIAGIGGLFIGLALAEKLDLPLLQAYLLPFTPTVEFASVLLPGSLSRLGGGFNRASHHLTRQFMWQGSRAGDEAARRGVLGLPPAPLTGPFHSGHLLNEPVLYGLSPAVMPRPADWPEARLTGYWFLDAEPGWTPPADLERFLEAGDPPVCIGFGSMSSRKPEETTRMVLEALARTGRRAVLLSGWGGMRSADLPPTVYMAGALPHAWIFPRAAAVVHHGGAGTTAAGLRAGVPSVLTPFFGDQPFWGERVAALGAGPGPIPRNRLDARRLADAIEIAVTDASMRTRAAELGARIRAEDGLAEAARVVGGLRL